MGAIASISLRDCADLPEFVLPNHNKKCKPSQGKVAFMAFVKNSYDFTDIEDGDEWTSAMGSDDLIVIRTAGEQPDPTPRKTTGAGESEEELLNFRWLVNTQFFTVMENLGFMDALNNASGEYGIFYITSDFTGFVPLTEGKYSNIDFTCYPTIPAGQTEKVTGTVMCEWTERHQPYAFTAPADVLKALPKFDTGS